jgi:hypothetical protein
MWTFWVNRVAFLSRVSQYLPERKGNSMRKLFILIAVLVTAGQGMYAAREATNTINNFTNVGGTYSFDVWSRNTDTDPIYVGTSSLYFDYNSSGLSNPTLTNINPNYTGTVDLFEGYDAMSIGITSGLIGVTIKRDFGPPVQLSTSGPAGERICTVNLTVTDPSEAAGVTWSTVNSAITDAASNFVSNAFAGSDNSPLPIQLASLTATAVNQNEVRVDWTTATETNNYGFEVEKAADTPTNYQTIANSFVAGHGTTIQPHSYTFTDAAASPGIWYYRLKQIDLDGTVHYTEGMQVDLVTGVEEEEVPTVFALDQNYPNPFNPSTVIEFALPKEEHVVLEVYNMLGQRVKTLVNEVRPVGYYAVPFNAEGLASGLYFYRLYTTEVSLLKKMVLLK